MLALTITKGNIALPMPPPCGDAIRHWRCTQPIGKRVSDHRAAKLTDPFEKVTSKQHECERKHRGKQTEWIQSNLITTEYLFLLFARRFVSIFRVIVVHFGVAKAHTLRCLSRQTQLNTHTHNAIELAAKFESFSIMTQRSRNHWILTEHGLGTAWWWLGLACSWQGCHSLDAFRVLKCVMAHHRCYFTHALSSWLRKVHRLVIWLILKFV